MSRSAPRLVLAACVCGIFAWLAGPPGRLLVLLPLLLFGPGYLIARILQLRPPLPTFTAPALWLGLSLSSIAVLYLWAWTVSLALSTTILSLLFVALAAALAWFCWEEASVPVAPTPPNLWVGLAYLAVIMLTLVTRFVQIRDLALPAWVDSVHHALLVRVVAETGQLPFSLRPYLPVDGLPYHWGYHAFAGMLFQLSGLELPQLMLWSGQVLNTLSVVAVAGLAALIWRSPVAAIGAAMVTGLLSNMPAYYVSWGRYTQLTGLLVLPALTMVSLLLWQAMGKAQHTGQPFSACRQVTSLMSCTALLLAGLVLIHYRVLVFWLPLLALTALIYHGSTPTTLRAWLSRTLLFGILPAIGAALLTLPWLLVLVQRVLLNLMRQSGGLVGSESYNQLNTALLWTGNNRWLFVLAGLAGLAALWRRRPAAALVVCWVAALMLMANPGVVGLPSLWLISNDSVLILLYLPASLLIGGGLALIAQGTTGRVAHTALALALAAAGIYGTNQQFDIINQTTVLAGNDDLEAIRWAGLHTPPDARFLVSAQPWLTRVNRGGDGGWWLLPLAGRWVSTPPVLYTYAERPEIEVVYARTTALASLTADSVAEMDTLIRDNQITHIYTSGTSGSFPADLLARIEGLKPVYRRGSVVIYEVETR